VASAGSVRRSIIASQATVSRNSRVPDEQRIAAARRFAIEAARHFAATRCQNVVVLDMQGISPITDFTVIGTGTSPRQMRTVVDQLEEAAAPQGHQKLSRSGDDSGQWIVTDFVDVICHVFSPEARTYYDLDNLWGDAKRVEWEEVKR
jgi:ribosome-associated protein